jgi:hypothetical protein
MSTNNTLSIGIVSGYFSGFAGFVFVFGMLTIVFANASRSYKHITIFQRDLLFFIAFVQTTVVSHGMKI